MVFCSAITNNKWKAFAALARSGDKRLMGDGLTKGGSPLIRTSTQTGPMAEAGEEVGVFPKTQLLHWKVQLLPCQPPGSTAPSSR